MKEAIIKHVEEKIPDFAKMIQDYVKTPDDEKPDAIIMHQSAFGADFQLDEMLLLGCAIKYAGIYGCKLMIIV